MSELLMRGLLPLGLAVATAVAVDWSSALRGLQPPAFAVGGPEGSPWRRAVFLSLLALGLYVAVFQSIAAIGLEQEFDPDAISTWQLFWVHGILVALMAAWYLLGFAGTRAAAGHLASEWWRQFGLSSRAVGRELLLGLGLGVLGWGGVLAVVSLVALITGRLLGPDALPDTVPGAIVWMASLSLPLRFLVATSAGVVEELFFRGFLQPRVGIAASTILFAIAHLSYGQPFLMVGVTLLSLGFAFLCRWRGSIWAAIAAHFTFDAIQLLILIPWALRLAGEIAA